LNRKFNQSPLYRFSDEMKKLKIYDKLIRQIFTEVLCYNK